MTKKGRKAKHKKRYKVFPTERVTILYPICLICRDVDCNGCHKPCTTCTNRIDGLQQSTRKATQ